MKGLNRHRFLLTIAFCCLCKLVSAQIPDYLTNGTLSTVYKSVHQEELDGTLYFYSDWTPGEARLSDGKTYKGMMLMYNEMSGQLTFKYTAADTAMMFGLKPVEFRLIDSKSDTVYNPHFLNGFKPVDGNNEDSFYQVLIDGPTKLLKKTVKRIAKTTAYGSEAAVSKITAASSYYIAKGNQPVKVKNDLKSILNVLNDKTGKLQEYIAANKLDPKKDYDFARIVNFYNAISKSS